MRLRRETGLGIGTILALEVLLAMLAIVLLTRMGPAIQRILEENVYSGEAVEEMVALLALEDAGPVPAEFDDALRRARDNVTEEAEQPLLDEIVHERKAAFAGDARARAHVVEALRRLGKVNRDSMIRADVRAQRLGQAGAWAAAMLGAFALGLAIIIYRRLRLRLELPVERVRQTTLVIREGNLHARCATTQGPWEIREIAADVNWILDRWLLDRQPVQRLGDQEREAEIRRVLGWLLDREPHPVALLDDAGAKVVTNRACVEVDLESMVEWNVEPVPGTSLRLARAKPPAVS